MKTLTYSLLCMCLWGVQAFAQGSADVEMADALRSSGKIYVVVVVVAVVLVGILAYLLLLDRRVQQLEREEQQG